MVCPKCDHDVALTEKGLLVRHAAARGAFRSAGHDICHASGTEAVR